MKSFRFTAILQLLIVLMSFTAQAQNPLTVVDTPGTSLWRFYAADTNLTYAQIITKCDSLFELQADADTAEDGEKANYDRWKFFWATRLNSSSGKLFDINAAIKQKILNNNLQVCGGANPEQNNDGWKFVGPQNMSNQRYGRIDEISINPSNKNEIYAASWWGGLWKTTSGGQNWTCLSDNDPDLSGIGIQKFVVDYSVTPHRIYAIVGVPASAMSPTRIVGLFISADDGQTFQLANVPINIEDQIGDLKKIPGVNQLIIAYGKKLDRLAVSWSGSSFTITDYSLVDYSAVSGFKGFHSISMKSSDPSEIYFSSYSGWEGLNCSAMLFRIKDVYNTQDPTNFQNITGKLQNGFQNLITDGNFSSNHRWNFPGNPGPNDWVRTSAHAEVIPLATGTSSCLSQDIGGFPDGTALTYAFSCNTTLPAYTRIVVKLVQVQSGSPAGCYSGAVFKTIYDSGNPVASAQTLNINLSNLDNEISSVNQYLNRLVVEVTATGSYSGTPVTLDNVVLKSTYFEYITTAASETSQDKVVIAATDPIDYVSGYPSNISLQLTDNCTSCGNISGETWSEFNRVNCTSMWGLAFGKIAMSTIDPKTVYLSGTDFRFATENTGAMPVYIGVCLDWIYEADFSTYSHGDVRNITIWRNAANNTEELYIGHDGGITKSNTLDLANNHATWTPIIGNNNTYNTVNQIGCSLPYGIGTNCFTGNIAVGLQDNGVIRAKEDDKYHWSHIEGGDGFMFKYFKRKVINGGVSYDRSYVFSDNGSSTNDFHVILDNGQTHINSVNTGPKDLSGLFYRPKTTFGGEYYGNSSIFRLKADGSDWENVTEHDQSGYFANYPSHMMAIAPDMYDKGKIAVCMSPSFWEGQNAKIYFTTDADPVSSHWYLEGAQGSPGRVFISMFMDPKPYNQTTATRIWGGCGWYDGNNGSGQHRVYESVNDGANWTDISTGLPDGPVNVLEFDDRARILYAGTDFGIYFLDVDAPTREWKCFSKNLPNPFIYDLDINYCTGKIYAAAFGRGAWESDLQPNPRWDDANDTYSTEVIGDPSHLTTWNTSTSKFKTVIVPAGEKLRIAGTSSNPITINMGYKTHIIVKTGGTLIVENATLTNECGAMWGGIVVEGDPSFANQTINSITDFSNQGYVKLLPGAVIENAVTGVNASGIDYITTGSNTAYSTYKPGYGGGVIIATGTSSTQRDVVFRNCANDINFFDYNHSNFSSFKNCTFIANKYLPDDRQIDYQDPSGPARKGTMTFVNNWACHTLAFSYCTFKTDLSNPSVFNPRADLRGRAYMSFDAGANFDHCDFENLNRGLMCGSSVSFKRPSARYCTFTNVWRAASFRGVNDPVFMDNTVTEGSGCSYTQYDMNTDESDLFALYPFGVYYSAGNSFRIRYNDISKAGTAAYQFGIIMNNTWSGTKLSEQSLYRNTITDVKFGVNMFQDARGVQIKCNTLETGSIGILAVPSQVAAARVSDQGNCLGSGTTHEYEAPAGNRFNQHTVAGNPCINGSHIESLNGNPPNDFFYNEHTNDPYRALCLSGTSSGTVQIQPPHQCLQQCPDFDVCCPIVAADEGDWSADDPIYPGGSLNGLQQGIAGLQEDLDNGSSGVLLEDISNESIASVDLKNLLMDAGHYLSDEVLIAAINRSSFEYDDLKEVLIANSFLRNGVWEALQNRDDGLVDDQELIDAQSRYSERAMVEGNLRDLYGQRNDLIAHFADYYIGHEYYDSAAALYMTYGGYEQAVSLYLTTGNTESATGAANVIPDSLVKQIALLQINRAENGRTYDSLSTDELSLLESIAESPYTRAGEKARMWLMAAKGITSIELMPQVSDGEGKMVPQPNGQKEEAAKQSFVKVYPNPAKDEINVSMNTGVLGEGTVISAYDMTGRRMVRYVPEPGKQKATLNSSGWSSGIYIITVQRSNGALTTNKVTIAR